MSSHSNGAPEHTPWRFLQTGHIRQFVQALIPSARSAAREAQTALGPLANDPTAAKAELSRTQSYAEVITFKMIPALPGQMTLQIHSRNFDAADPRQWVLRHQVIMDRANLFHMRDAVDRFLAITVDFDTEAQR